MPSGSSDLWTRPDSPQDLPEVVPFAECIKSGITPERIRTIEASLDGMLQPANGFVRSVEPDQDAGGVVGVPTANQIAAPAGAREDRAPAPTTSTNHGCT